MTERVREILSWYAGSNAGTLTNLARMLNHGRLGGTGVWSLLDSGRRRLTRNGE